MRLDLSSKTIIVTPVETKLFIINLILKKVFGKNKLKRKKKLKF